MNPSLIKEREAFLKRAMAMPVVEKPKVNSAAIPSSSSSAAAALEGNSLRRPPPSVASSSSSSSVSTELRSIDSTRPSLLQGKFAVLSRIVKYMKQRHLEGDTHPLSVDEILEEAVLHDTPPATIRWLEEEDRKFVFRPKYDIRTRKDLYQLLRRQELKGLGGIYLDDLTESIPDVEKIIASFGDHVIRIVTPHDKKTILFYNDKSFDLNVDEGK
ncbi:unnamed protein product [Trichobilharzia regenti]|nr:unnamed protein product [Trichobilharzia regenti]